MTIAWIAPTLRPRRESPDRNARRQAHRRRFALEQFEDRTLLSGVWRGTIDNDWFNPGNWDDGKAPTSTTNVVINPCNVGDDGFTSVNIGTTTNTVAKSLKLENGATLTGDLLELRGNLTVADDPTTTFSVDTVRFAGTHAATISAASLQNVTVGFNGQAGIAGASPLLVKGDLKVNNAGAISGGPITVMGNITTSNTWSQLGAGSIILAGSGHQTISSGPNGGSLLGLKFEKTGGSVTIASGSKLKLSGGLLVNQPSNIPFNAGGSTVQFFATYGTTIDTGYASLGSVEFNKNGQVAVNVQNNLKIGGDLTILAVDKINAPLGAITVAGNLTSKDTSVKGTADITNDKNILIPSNFPNGGVIINKSGDGKLTIGGSNTNMFRVMGDWEYIAGDVDASSSKIQFMKTNGNTTIRPGTMKFGDVIVSIGSNKMDIVDANDCAVDALYTGTYTKSSGTINKGRFVKYTP